ncbi:unnamed protein product, partial [marine sediment metagenome]
MVMITPQILQNPKILTIKLGNLKNISSSVFALYSHVGFKVLEQSLDVPLSDDIITGDKIFRNNFKVPYGVYFYKIENKKLKANSYFSKNAPYFRDVSLSNLPEDSILGAFTEFADVNNDSFPDIIVGIAHPIVGS